MTFAKQKLLSLAPNFCMMQTANDLEAIQSIDSIDAQIEVFAKNILQTIRSRDIPENLG